MVRKLNESDDYIKISKDYDDLVLRSIQIAKEMGIEQIIFQSKDGFFGSILAKNGKPVSPLNDGDNVIGKIRLVNRAGKKDAVYVTDYPVKESIKRKRRSMKMRESIDSDSLFELIEKAKDEIETLSYTLWKLDSELLDKLASGFNFDNEDEKRDFEYAFSVIKEKLEYDVNNATYDIESKINDYIK